MPHYSATAIQEWERAISCKRKCHFEESKTTMWLIGFDDSSLVIDRLCAETAKEGTAVVCFCFDFAARNEQSPVYMLGSLLGDTSTSKRENIMENHKNIGYFL